MKKQSAGLLIFKKERNEILFLLVHPGGPFWRNKDPGAWSIPKGEFSDGELAIDAAKREAREELGMDIVGEFIELNPAKMSSGKIIYAWAVEADLDPALIRSNTCEIEWPPRSGKKILIPEIDRGEWFNIEQARKKLVRGQMPLIDGLLEGFTRRSQR